MVVGTGATVSTDGLVSAGSSVAAVVLGTAPKPGVASSVDRPMRNPPVPAINAAAVAITTARRPRRSKRWTGDSISIISNLPRWHVRRRALANSSPGLLNFCQARPAGERVERHGCPALGLYRHETQPADAIADQFVRARGVGVDQL